MGCLHSTLKRSTSDTSEYTQHQKDCIDLQATQKKKALIVEILKQSFKNEESDENTVSKNDAAKESMVPLPGEDELFCEMLYQNSHPISNDISKEQQNRNLVFLKNVFCVDQNQVEKKVAEATNKKDAEKRVNFKVIEANGFESKGRCVNCFAYMKSNPQTKIETQLIPDSKALSWNFTGSLPIQSAETDLLVIEVWTHPKTTSKKQMKSESKNGLSKFMKNPLKTDAKSKLSCSVELSLKNIPLLGAQQWAELSKKKRNVHVFLSLGTCKDVQEACSEHRQLTRVLVRNQLRTAASPFTWDGELSGAAEQILLLHRAHTSLEQQHALLARWAGYCDHHEHAPFNFKALETLLRKLLALQPSEEKNFNEKEARIFWSSKKTLIPNCLDFFRSLFDLSESCGKSIDMQLNSMLRMLSMMLPIKAPDDLATLTRYRSLNSEVDSNSTKIRKQVRNALKDSAREWVDYTFSTIQQEKNEEKKQEEQVTKPDVEQNNDAESASKEEMVQILINCNQDITAIKDLLTMANYEERFRYIEVDFICAVTEVFDKKVHDVVKPLVTSVCKKLKSAKTSMGGEELISQDNYKIVIELYCNLQSFTKIGESSLNGQKMKCGDFHTWFAVGVHEQWLDIIFVKALNYIDGALERDSPEDGSRCTSSVVDVLEIFKMLEGHITSLQTSNEEKEISFMTLGLVEKIAKCTEYYTDQMVAKVGQGKNDEIRICTTMNNIESIRTRGVEPLLQKLDLESAFTNMNKISSSVAKCQDILKALKRVVDAANYTEEKMKHLGKTLSKQISLKFKEDEFLTQFGLMNQSVAYHHFERLEKLLSEYNYKMFLSLFSKNLVKYFEQTINSAKWDSKPPIYFHNLRQSLVDFEKDFILERNLSCGVEVEKLKKSLEALSIDPVHIFCLERLNIVDEVNVPDKKGEIKLAVEMKNNELKVKVLNACNLETTNKNDLCNAYVRLQLHPEHNFSSAAKGKTQIRRNAPKKDVAFEQAFDFAMERHVENVGQNVLHLTVKDYKMFGRNKVIGETAISFDKLNSALDPDSPDSMPLIEIPLVKLDKTPSKNVTANWKRVMNPIRKSLIRK